MLGRRESNHGSLLKAALLIVGIQIAIGVVLAMEAGKRNGKNMALLFAVCLISSHGSLLGTWGALSSWRPPARLLVLAISTIFLTAELGLAAKLSPIASLLIAIAPIARQFAFLSVRSIGTSFLQLDSSVRRAQSARPQFTIMQILAFTTIIALLTSISRFISVPTKPLLPIRLGDDYLVDMATFSLCAMFVAMASSWSLFSLRWSSLQWLATLGAPVLAGVFPLIYRGGPEPWIFVFVAFIQEAIIGMALLPLRALGYRCIKRGFSSTDSPSSSIERSSAIFR
jgi:hypothetical protein